MRILRRKQQSPLLRPKIGEYLFSSKIFPLMLTFAFLGILFVLFRMNSVDIDYRIASLNKDLEKITLESKELKAQKARLLSIRRLRNLAQKYELQQPHQNQIIIIPST